MLKCERVAEWASASQDNKLTLLERGRLRWHLLRCAPCREYLRGLAVTRELLSKQDRSPDPQWLQQLEDTVAAHLPQDHLPPDDNPSWAPTDEQLNDSRVQKIFQEIQSHEGSVPNLYRAYAHNPDVLERNWEKVKSLMYGGQLSGQLKNAIALLVSWDNHCDYCVFHHRRMLMQLGVDTRAVDRLLRQGDGDFLEPREELLLRLARESNRNPHGTHAQAMNALWEAGITNAEMVEALGIMELYSSFNRFLDTMKVPLESGIS